MTRMPRALASPRYVPSDGPQADDSHRLLENSSGK